jgi:DNA-binding GntR family transcriptional regulator
VLPRKGYLIRPLKLEDVREIFAVRLMLEPAVAAHAAGIVDAAGIAKLNGHLQRQAAAESTPAALTAARDFHIGVAEIVGNARVSRSLLDLFDEVRRLHFLLPNVESHITSDEELKAHERLIEALSAHDSELASDLMRNHVNEVARTLVRGFGGV